MVLFSKDGLIKLAEDIVKWKSASLNGQPPSKLLIGGPDVSATVYNTEDFSGFPVNLFLEEPSKTLNDHELLDPRLIYENAAEKEATSQEILREKWVELWTTFAKRFGSSLVTYGKDNAVSGVLPRKPCVIPHVSPVWAVIVYPEQVALITPQFGQEWHSLPTIMRFAYRNLDQHSEAMHIVVSGLLECCNQLARRGVFAEYSTDLFLSDNVLWLLCNPVSALLSMCDNNRGSNSNSKSSTSIQSTPTFTRLSDATEAWRTRKLSNLNYILILNEFAGRRRGEIHNHPVVPWVCDFSEENGGWRPLNRTKFRLQKGDDQLREMHQREPAHHVAELLSDIGYMVYRARVESKEALCKHVRSKWVPREYPLSLRRMYEWTPDECIPELYEDGSLIKSRHEDMPDLELPSFIRDADHFVRWHREMLESDQVSEHLHEWIDLAFGYKLSGEDAVNALNVHLCFAEKQPKLLTTGVVQLFFRSHPKRIPSTPAPEKNLVGLSNEYQNLLDGQGLDETDSDSPKHRPLSRTLACDDNSVSDTQALASSFSSRSTSSNDETGIENLVSAYRTLLARHRSLPSAKVRCVRSLFVTFVEIALSEYCNDLERHARLELRIERAQRFLKQQTARLPRHFRTTFTRVFSVCLSYTARLPDLSHLHLFLLHTLCVPVDVIVLQDQLAYFYAHHIIRRHSVDASNDKARASALHGELESVSQCMCMVDGGSRDRECRLVRVIEKLLDDDQSAIVAVSRLFPVACRAFSNHSLNLLLTPLKRLLHSEVSVKLLDRRFLLQVSIAYGAQVFLDEVAPTLVEAVASRLQDRSIVAKESIIWLAKRYGPVVCAKFLSSNLLRILASCYANMEGIPAHRVVQGVFSLQLDGDLTGMRVEGCLAEIPQIYSTTFVTVQYLPFCADLVEQACRRGVSPQAEPALISVIRIARLSMRALNDTQLMNYLEDFVIDKIVQRIVELVCQESSSFSSVEARRIIASKAIFLLLDISLRVGADNARMYSKGPFELLFDMFSGLYEANEELHLHAKQGASEVLLQTFPLWFVQSVVGRFSAEWGVPLLSSLCSNPVFLVPFVSAHGASSPTTSSYGMTGVSSGNRLFSLSSPANSVGSTIVGGSGCFDSGGNLSNLWCARVSAAVCGNGVRQPPRFDQLTLCTFSGHQGTIRRLASLSNENSFVSASSDKTVKLWSIKPEHDVAQCQWTYKGHSRTVYDVHLMQSSLIASTDGVLRVWDPFHGNDVSQLEWGSENAICCLDSLDRHTLAAASSLHSTIKIYDTRTSGWAAELRISPIAGMVRAMSVHENRMAVALSNGTVAMMDPRTGRVSSLSHGNHTHATGIRWLSSRSFIVSDNEDEGVVFEVTPRIQAKWRTADPIQSMTASGDLLITIQQTNLFRLYSSQDLTLESKLKSDLLPGQVSAIAYLPLNNAFLIGSNSGAIRMMC